VETALRFPLALSATDLTLPAEEAKQALLLQKQLTGSPNIYRAGINIAKLKGPTTPQNGRRCPCIMILLYMEAPFNVP